MRSGTALPCLTAVGTLGTSAKADIHIDELQNLMAGGKELQAVAHELGGTV